MFTIVAATVVLVLVLIFSCIKNGNKNRKIPGPAGSPIVGNLFQIEYEKMHLTLDQLASKFGDIFQLNIMGQKIISLNSSAIIRDVFLHEPNATICAARPPTFFGKYPMENFSDVAFSSPDKQWTQRRKMFFAQIKSYGEGLDQIEKEMTKSLRKMKADIKLVAGETICPEEIICEILLKTVETLMVGRCFGKDGELQILLTKMDVNFNIISNMGTDILYSIFPVLRFLPLRNSYLLKEFEEQKFELMNLLAKIAKENPEHKGVYQGFMDEVKRHEGLDNQFIETNVRAMLMNLISAAFNTTRGTLLSAVHILAKRPDLQKSLQAEVDRVIGRDREPTLQDKDRCPLIGSFLMETLRYISHVPMSVFHYTSDSCVINGYHIDKDTIVIPNIYTAHHNKKEWDRPFDFIPDRFLDKSGNLLPATDDIRKRNQAFGIGKRSCIGEVFARSRMFLFMATLMQTASLAEPDYGSLVDFSLDQLTPGLVMQPKPYKLKFVLRD